MVEDTGEGISDIRGYVVGYESATVLTKEGGNFSLPFQAATGQQVLR